MTNQSSQHDKDGRAKTVISFWSESIICMYLVVRNRSVYGYIDTYHIQCLLERSCS
jgi:hypothetical protein